MVCALIFSAAMVAVGQSASVVSRITSAVDEKNLVTLKGNTHPIAAPQFDRGEAPGSLPMNRMLLELQHAPAQEAAIKQLLAEQQNQGSANFRNWPTPQQYGQMFGPSDQDIQARSKLWRGRGGDQRDHIDSIELATLFDGARVQVKAEARPPWTRGRASYLCAVLKAGAIVAGKVKGARLKCRRQLPIDPALRDLR